MGKGMTGNLHLWRAGKMSLLGGIKHFLLEQGCMKIDGEEGAGR